MSFGVHYQYQEQPEILPDGTYDVTLEKPFETSVAGFRVLRFPFIVDGKKPNVRPNYFDLFDCTDPADKEKLDFFNSRASRIIECFCLFGSFTEEAYQNWKGLKGRVEITKSKEGFVNVSKFYKNPNFKGYKPEFDLY